MVHKNKVEKDSKEKINKNSKTYIIGAVVVVVVVALILFLALANKDKEIATPEETEANEEEQEIIIPPPIASYDLSAYANDLVSYAGKEATLIGYLKWEEEVNNNNAAIQKYYVVDSYDNRVLLAFAGIKIDFSQYESLFIKGETTTQAYEVKGRFVKNFDVIRFEVASITEK